MRSRTRQRSSDAEARILIPGYGRLWKLLHCDDCPTEHGAGGYHFWRCTRLRFHPGAHRGENYAWPRGGEVFYDPLPIARLREPRRGYSWLTGLVRKGARLGYGDRP